jgi:hypothetical protein
MRASQIETWAIKVLEQVEAGQPNEDARVELKSEWLDPKDMAHPLAGHANAALGEPILWLIGVDQKAGLVNGACEKELADWYPQVQTHFDEMCPSVTPVNVPWNGVIVVALLFEADRAPFVVKNPAHGTQGGGPIAFEVPWRGNTSTRSARRRELLTLLAPLQTLPSVEVLEAWLSVTQIEDGTDEVRWTVFLDLYVTPSSPQRVVIPFHRCRVSFTGEGEIGRVSFGWVPLRPPCAPNDLEGASVQAYSRTIIGARTELLIDGPGNAWLNAIERTSRPSGPLGGVLKVAAELQPANAERPVSVPVSLSSFPFPEGFRGTDRGAPDGERRPLLGVWYLYNLPDWLVGQLKAQPRNPHRPR